MLLISYLVLNLILLRNKASKKGSDIDGIDNEINEKEAILREKIERFTVTLNGYVAIISKVVGWAVSTILIVASLLLFGAIYCALFEAEWLSSTSLFGFSFLSQIIVNYGLQSTLYGLVIAAIALICIVYTVITLLMKRKPDRWVLFSALAIWIILIVCAIVSRDL